MADDAESKITTIERFQSLQIELVRAGFDTDLHARPDRKGARVVMMLDLRRHTGGVENRELEELGTLLHSRGFGYSIGENSLAEIRLADNGK